VLPGILGARILETHAGGVAPPATPQGKIMTDHDETAHELQTVKAQLAWVTAWDERAIRAMGKVAPDAPRLEDLEDEWDAYHADKPQEAAT
jgi:hypothetical protein